MSLPLRCLLLLLLTGCAPSTFDSESCREGTGVGDCAPTFELEAIDGSHVDPFDLGGDRLILLFGEAWCPLCQQLAIQLEDLWQESGDSGLRVVAVLGEDARGEPIDPSEALEFADHLDLTFPVLADPDGAASEAWLFGLQRPRTYVLDSDRLVRYRTVGLRPGTVEEIRAEEAALAQEAESVAGP